MSKRSSRNEYSVKSLAWIPKVNKFEVYWKWPDNPWTREPLENLRGISRDIIFYARAHPDLLTPVSVWELRRSGDQFEVKINQFEAPESFPQECVGWLGQEFLAVVTDTWVRPIGRETIILTPKSIPADAAFPCCKWKRSRLGERDFYCLTDSIKRVLKLKEPSAEVPDLKHGSLEMLPDGYDFFWFGVPQLKPHLLPVMAISENHCHVVSEMPDDLKRYSRHRFVGIDLRPKVKLE